MAWSHEIFQTLSFYEKMMDLPILFLSTFPATKLGESIFSSNRVETLTLQQQTKEKEKSSFATKMLSGHGGWCEDVAEAKYWETGTKLLPGGASAGNMNCQVCSRALGGLAWSQCLVIAKPQTFEN